MKLHLYSYRWDRLFLWLLLYCCRLTWHTHTLTHKHSESPFVAVAKGKLEAHGCHNIKCLIRCYKCTRTQRQQAADKATNKKRHDGKKTLKLHLSGWDRQLIPVPTYCCRFLKRPRCCRGSFSAKPPFLTICCCGYFSSSCEFYSVALPATAVCVYQYVFLYS